MNEAELAREEDELQKVLTGSGALQGEGDRRLHEVGVYARYKQIHSSYAERADKNLESLKRGLFIQWFALMEPPYLSGINDLDSDSERKVMRQVEQLIISDNLDNELKWMLGFYANWTWVFERFREFKEFQNWFKNQLGIELPQWIDKNEMEERGIMGKYFASERNRAGRQN